MTSSGIHADTKLSAHSKVRLGITYYLFSASKTYCAQWKVKHLAESEYRVCLKKTQILRGSQWHTREEKYKILHPILSLEHEN